MATSLQELLASLKDRLVSRSRLPENDLTALIKAQSLLVRTSVDQEFYLVNVAVGLCLTVLSQSRDDADIDLLSRSCLECCISALERHPQDIDLRSICKEVTCALLRVRAGQSFENFSLQFHEALSVPAFGNLDVLDDPEIELDEATSDETAHKTKDLGTLNKKQLVHSEYSVLSRLCKVCAVQINVQKANLRSSTMPKDIASISWWVDFAFEISTLSVHNNLADSDKSQLAEMYVVPSALLLASAVVVYVDEMLKQGVTPEREVRPQKKSRSDNRSSSTWTLEELRLFSKSVQGLLSRLVLMVGNVAGVDSSVYWIFCGAVCRTAVCALLPNYALYEEMLEQSESQSSLRLQLEMEITLYWELLSYVLQTFRVFCNLGLDQPLRSTVGPVLLGIGEGQQARGELFRKIFVILNCLRIQCEKEARHGFRERSGDHKTSSSQWQDVAQTLFTDLVFLCGQPELSQCIKSLELSHLSLLLALSRLPNSPLKQVFETSLTDFGQILFSQTLICREFGTQVLRQLTNKDGSLLDNLPMSVWKFLARMLIVECENSEEVVNVFVDAFLVELESALDNDSFVFQNISFVASIFKTWSAPARSTFVTRFIEAIMRWVQSLDEERLFKLQHCCCWQLIFLLLNNALHNTSAPKSPLSLEHCISNVDASDVQFAHIVSLLKLPYCTHIIIPELASSTVSYSSRSFRETLDSFLEKICLKMLSTDDIEEETFPNKRHRGGEPSQRSKRSGRQSSRSRSLGQESSTSKRKRGQDASLVSERYGPTLHLFFTLSDLICALPSFAENRAVSIDFDSLLGVHQTNQTLKNFLSSAAKQATLTAASEVSESKIGSLVDCFSVLEQAQARFDSGAFLHCELVNSIVDAVLTVISRSPAQIQSHTSRFLTNVCSLLESYYRIYCEAVKEFLDSLDLQAFHELSLSNSHSIVFNSLAFSQGKYSLLPSTYDTQFPTICEKPIAQSSNPTLYFVLETLLFQHFSPYSTLSTKIHSLKCVISTCLNAVHQVWDIYLSETALFRNNIITAHVLSLCQAIEGNRFFGFVQGTAAQLITLGFQEISNVLPLTEYVRAYGPACTREWISARRVYSMIACIIQSLPAYGATPPSLLLLLMARCLELMKLFISQGSFYFVLVIQARESGQSLSDVIADFVLPLLILANQSGKLGSDTKLTQQCLDCVLTVACFGSEFKAAVAQAFIRFDRNEFDAFVTKIFLGLGSKPSSSGLSAFLLLKEMARPMSSKSAVCDEFNQRLFDRILLELQVILASNISNAQLTACFTILASIASCMDQASKLVSALLSLAASSPANSLCSVLNLLTELLESVAIELPLKKKPCSFVQTGTFPTLQHVFECLTCGSSSCCSVCVTLCHPNHNVVYSGERPTTCDCSNACKARTELQTSLLVEEVLQSDLERFAVSVLQQFVKSVGSNPQLVYLPQVLTATLTPSKTLTTGLFTSSNNAPSANNFLQGLLTGQLRRDSGISKFSVQPHVMAVISSNMLVIAEGSRLNIFNRLKAIQPQNSSSKPSNASKSKSRNDLRLLVEETMPFSVVSLKANPGNLAQVAVCGRKQCHVVTFGSSGNITQRVVVELSLDVLQQQDESSSERLTLLKAEWVPRSQFLLIVTTNKFVKIYDLSKDTICPEFNCNAPQNALIKDATIANHGSLIVFVLTADGRIFTDVVTMGSGPHDLTTTLNGFRSRSKGKSIHYSHTTARLFVSWMAQTCCTLRIDSALNCVEVHSLNVPEPNGKFRDLPIEITSWLDLDDPQVQDRDFTYSVPSAMAGAVAGLMSDKDNLRLVIIHVVGNRIPVCTLTAPSERKIIGLVDSGCVSEQPSVCLLHDNGSLSHFLFTPTSALNNLPLTTFTGQEELLQAFLPASSEEPPNRWLCDVTVFQRAQRAQLRLEGDIDDALLRDPDTEATSPSSEHCILRARGVIATQYIVGLRVYVGSRGSSFLYLAELGREVALDLNGWTDIAFSYVESQLLAMHSNLLTLTFAVPSHHVVLNAIEVYVLPRSSLDTTFVSELKELVAETLCVATSPPCALTEVPPREWSPWTACETWTKLPTTSKYAARLSFAALSAPVSSSPFYTLGSSQSAPSNYTSTSIFHSPLPSSSSSFVPASALLHSNHEIPEVVAMSPFPPGVFYSRAEFAQWHVANNLPMPSPSSVLSSSPLASASSSPSIVQSPSVTSPSSFGLSDLFVPTLASDKLRAAYNEPNNEISTLHLSSSMFRFIRRVWDRKQNEDFKQRLMQEMQTMIIRVPAEVAADASWTFQGVSSDLQAALEHLTQGAFEVRDIWVFEGLQRQLNQSSMVFWNCMKIVRAIANSRPKAFQNFVQKQPQFAIDLLSPVCSMVQKDDGWMMSDIAFETMSRCLQILGPQAEIVSLVTDGLLCVSEEKSFQDISRQVRYSAISQLALVFFPQNRKRVKASASLSQDVNMARLQSQGKAVRYRCDSCNLFPIANFRWRCLNEVCKEFDLCEDCHSKTIENKQVGSHRRSHAMERFAVNNGPPSEDDNEKLYDRILVPPGVDSHDNETLMRMAVAMSLSLSPSTESFEVYLPTLLAVCRRLVPLVASLPPQQALDRLPYLHFLLSCTVHFVLEDDTLHLIVDLITKEFLTPGIEIQNRLLNALFLKAVLNVPHNRPVAPYLLENFLQLQSELWDIVQITVAHPFPQSPIGSGLLHARLCGLDLVTSLLFDRKLTVDTLFNDASHRLLTAVLSLLLTLFPTSLSGPSRETKMQCLCEIIHGLDSSVGKYAKRLLDSVCGSEEERHKQFDQFLFLKEVTRLLQLPQSVELDGETALKFTYTTCRVIYSALVKVETCAKKRPQTWHSFVLSTPSFLQFLISLCVRLPPNAGPMLPTILHLLALLNTSKPPRSEVSDVLGTLITSVGKPDSAHVFGPIVSKFITSTQIQMFIQTCLLESPNLALREYARLALLFIWEHASDLRSRVVDILIQWLPFSSLHGPRARQLTNLVTTLASRGMRAQQWAQTARVLLDLMKTHQHVPDVDSSLVSALSLTLESNASATNTSDHAEPYYLSTQPCLVCNSGEQEFKNIKLKNLELETKFTSSTKLIRLNSRYWFKSLSIGLSSLDSAKLIRTVEVLFAPDPVSDLSGLPKDQWTLAETVVVDQGVKEVKINFAVPFSAHNLMIRFANFYQTNDALEVLTCPRCHFPVTNKHGNCPKCRENAYQCRSCRNINFENLDGFLCNECGFSRFASFHYAAVVRSCFLLSPITSESTRQTTVELISSLSDLLSQRYSQIANHQKDIRNLLAKSDADSKESPPGSALASARSLYNGKCRRLFEDLSECYQRLLHARFELARYVGKPRFVNVERDLPRKNVCPRCSSRFFNDCFIVIEELLKLNSELFRDLSSPSLEISTSSPYLDFPKSTALPFAADIELLLSMQSIRRERWRPLLSSLVHNNSLAFQALEDNVRRRFRAGEDHMHLLLWICKDLTRDWEACLSFLLNVFFDVLPLQVDNLILPFLTLIKAVCPVTVVQPSTVAPEHTRSSSRGQITTPRFPNRSPLRSSSSVWNLQRSPSRLRTGTPSPSPKASPATISAPAIALVPLNLKDEAKQPPNITASTEELLQHCAENYEIWRISAAPPHFSDWFDRRFCGALRNRTLGQKYVRKWLMCALGVRQKMPTPTSSCICCKFSGDGPPNFMAQLLFFPQVTIRIQMLGILQRMGGRIGLSRIPDIVKMCIWIITHRQAELQGTDESHLWDQFFALCDFLLRQDSHRRHQFVIKGVLSVLLDRINREIDSLCEAENAFSVDVVQCEPRVLAGLITLLVGLVEEPLIRNKFKREKMPEKALRAFLRLRGLVLQSSKATAECATTLFQVVQVSDTDEDKRGIIQGYLKALHLAGSTDKRTQIFILEQICSMIKPIQPARNCQFVLKKASSQEEFIRGSMKKNPYSLSDFKGDTMQSILNKIVQDLQIPLSDPNMFELLVDNRIINLSLPIVQVYDKIWLPSIQPSPLDMTMLVRDSEMQYMEDVVETPMMVVYRLTGLDGEATEDVVETLASNTQEIDPEQEYALASAMESGLSALLTRISSIKDMGQDLERKELDMLLKTTCYCCKLKTNRMKLLEWSPKQSQPRYGAACVAIFLRLLTISLKHPSAFEISKTLLDIITALLREIELQADLTNTTAEQAPAVGIGEETLQLQHVFESLGTFVNAKPTESFAEELMRILPGLTFGSNLLVVVVLEHFQPFLNWDQFDSTPHVARWIFYLKCFMKFCQCIPSTSIGGSIRDFLIEHGVTRSLFAHLAKVPSGESKSSEVVSIDSPSLPFILGALTGLVQNHQPSQQLAVDMGVIGVLHHVEGIASSNKLGPLAESLLEALSTGNDIVKAALLDLRSQTKENKKNIALAKRQKILQQMAFQRSKKDPSMLQATKAIAGLDQLDEQQGLRCLVCQEGYSFKPLEIMGLYVFNKAIPLGTEEDDIGVSTVTHFNVIHYSCHYDAMKADRRLKPPKTEWEGAAIRNSHTLCNNIFPIHGISLSDQVYEKKVEDYWATISPHCKLTRFELLVEDLRMLLSKFAYEESFSEYSKGGAKESNIKFILYIIQMGVHLFEKAPPPRHSVPTDVFSEGPSDVPVNILVETLMLWSYEDWESHKFALLRHTLLQQIPQEYEEQSSDDNEKERKVEKEQKGEVDAENLDLVGLCRPVFLMFALINSMHSVMYTPRSQSELPRLRTTAEVLSHKKRHIRTFDCLILQDLEHVVLKNYVGVILPCKTMEDFLEVTGMGSWLLTEESSGNLLITQLKNRWHESKVS